MMEHVSFGRKIFIVLIVALAYASGVSLGWIGRGAYDQPVGGIPTAAMQMAAPIENEAGQTATPPPTIGAPTSTLAPTQAILTSTPTVTATPTASLTPTADPTETTVSPSGAATEWSTPEVTRSPYHYGDQCSYSSQLGLFIWGDSEGKQWSLWDTRAIGDGGILVLGLDEVAGQLRWLVGDDEDPCINTGQLAGLDGLRFYLKEIGKEELQIPSVWIWNNNSWAIPTLTSIQTVTSTPTPTFFAYTEVCTYDISIDGNYYWLDWEGNLWSIWDTARHDHHHGRLVLAFDEISKELRWTWGEIEDPCVRDGHLAGVDGLQTYLQAVGQEELEIPALPEGWVNQNLED